MIAKIKLHRIFCTFFGVGNIKIAPGTFGSLAGFLLWFSMSYLFFKMNLVLIDAIIFWTLFLPLLFFIGVKAANIFEKETKQKDASIIVIDEVVGQILAICLSFYFFIMAFDSQGAILLYFVAVFILFRFFDIAKPGLIGYCDKKLKGGMGVMMDDIIAGIFSALIINFIVLLKLF